MRITNGVLARIRMTQRGGQTTLTKKRNYQNSPTPEKAGEEGRDALGRLGS